MKPVLKKPRPRSVKDLKASMEQGDMGAKRELAERMMIGKDVDKNETKAVSFLKDCVAHGDTDAMVVLANCCALGRGTEKDVIRGLALLLESAKNGNQDAQSYLKLLGKFKGKDTIQLYGL